MLRISKLTDYATVLLAHLAADGAGMKTALALAEDSHVGLPTVSKLLQELQRAGLVSATRGSHGGYRLARSSDDITAADIVDAVEGPVGLTECASHPGQCELEANCRVGPNWQRVSHAVRDVLMRITLTELSSQQPQANQALRVTDSTATRVTV